MRSIFRRSRFGLIVVCPYNHLFRLRRSIFSYRDMLKILFWGDFDTRRAMVFIICIIITFLMIFVDYDCMVSVCMSHANDFLRYLLAFCYLIICFVYIIAFIVMYDYYD